MKFYTLLIAILLSTFTLSAQQEEFKYQAVARDANNNALVNQNISIRFTIYEDDIPLKAVYQETHTTTTDALGIFYLSIGNGNVNTGTMSAVRWANIAHLLGVEMDETGGTTYQDMGKIPFLSVPYALHAYTVELNDDADADPTNELQEINLNGTTLSITDGNEIDIAGAFSSRWVYNTMTKELSYEDGDIRINSILMNENQAIYMEGSSGLYQDNKSLKKRSAVTPSQARFMDDNDDWVGVYGPTGSFVGKNSKVIHSLDKDALTFPDSFQNEYAQYSRDSMYIRNYTSLGANGQVEITYSAVDLGLRDFQLRMEAEGIKMENSVNSPNQKALFQADSLSFTSEDPSIPNIQFEKSTLDQFNIRFRDLGGNLGCFSTDFACLEEEGFFQTWDPMGATIFEKKNPQSLISRMRLNFDHLSMFSNEDTLLLKLGANDSQFPTGGNLQLFSVISPEPKVFLDASFGYGEFCMFDLEDICLFQANASQDYSEGGYFALSDSEGEERIFGYTEVFISGEEPTGVLEVDGLVYGHVVNSFFEDTIFSSLSPLGIFTEKQVSIDRARSTRSNIFHFPSYSTTMQTGGWDQGVVVTTGPNGNKNVELTTSVDPDVGLNANYGSVRVYDEDGNLRAGLEVRQFDGKSEVFADEKNFRMKHPNDNSKDIVYCSIEGPEAAAYTRGTGALENGKVFIAFPEHYQLVSNPATMTIQLTPLYANTIGLAVIEKTQEGFWVQERMGGTGNFEFDWIATCVRKGFENYEVIRDTKLK